MQSCCPAEQSGAAGQAAARKWIEAEVGLVRCCALMLGCGSTKKEEAIRTFGL